MDGMPMADVCDVLSAMRQIKAHNAVVRLQDSRIDFEIGR